MASVVQSPRRVQHVENVVTKLETGDLKLRVRVLESEQAFARIEAVQGSLSSAVMATLLLNAGVLMAGQAAGGAATLSSRAMFVLAGFFGIQIPVGYFKVSERHRRVLSFEIVLGMVFCLFLDVFFVKTQQIHLFGRQESGVE